MATKMAVTCAAPLALMAALPVVLTGCGSSGGSSGGSSPGQLKWKRHLYSIVSTPAVAEDGTVYIVSGLNSDGTEGGYVYGLNSDDGSSKWLWEFNERIYPLESTPAIGANGTAYIPFKGTLSPLENQMCAISRNTSHYKWAVTNHSMQYSPALGVDGTVFVAADHALLALDGDDGTVKWTLDSDVNISAAPLVGADGTVFASSRGPGCMANNATHCLSSVLALNPKDGSVKWRSAVEHPAWLQTLGASGALTMGTEGTLLVSVGFSVHALDSSNGLPKWNWTAPTDPYGGYWDTGILSAPTSGSDGTVFVTTSAREGCLVALDGDDGSLKWKFFPNWDDSLRFFPAKPAVSTDGTVYMTFDTATFQHGIAGASLLLLAVDAADGTEKWRYVPDYDPSTGVKGRPTIGSDGTVYVVSADGFLHAIQGEGGPVPTPGLQLLSTPKSHLAV